MNPELPTTNEIPIEPWLLTALALGELEPVERDRVQAALDSNPTLQREYAAIQKMLGAVTAVLEPSMQEVALAPEQSAQVVDRFASSVATAAPTLAMSGAQKSISPLVNKLPFYRRKQFAALLATAAMVPIGYFLLPQTAQRIADSTGFERESEPSSRKRNQEPKAGSPSDTASENGLSAGVQGTASMHESVALSASPTTSTPYDALAGLSAGRGSSPARGDGAPIVKDSAGGIRQSEKRLLEDGSTAGVPSNETEMVLEGMQTGKNSTAELASVAPASLGKAIDPAAMSALGGSTPGATVGPPAGYGGGGGMPAGYGGGSGGLGASDVEMPSGGLPGAGGGGSRFGTGLSDGSLDVGNQRGGMPIPGSGKGKPSSEEHRNESMGRSASPTASEAKDSPVANTDFARDHFGLELEVADGVRLPDELRANVPDRFFRYRGTNPQNNDRFEALVESPFLVTDKSPLSTFSIDVDTASYSKIRQYLSQSGAVPSPNMVRIEEMINYFEYDYEGPKDDTPFASHMAIDRCPWNPEHQLVRIGLQAKKVAASARPKANIVFLLDVSGSMNQPNRLPLVKKSLSLLANQLTENDRVAIVVYAGAAGCVLPSIAGSEKQAILSSLEHLNAGGSTNGGQGIQLAYSIAKENFVPGGINRVILCTDGDFNVGVTGDQALVEMMQQNAKSNVFLTCLGFGMGNYNDTMMEKISNQGNGVYGMIDNEIEARRMMVEQLSGTLVTVAKDVKIQVDFNPKKIASYRLIGYDDRRLANQDFANDAKDAGEIGAGHRVTALYEIVPVGNSETPAASSETSKYQAASQPASAAPVVQGNDAFADELLTLKVRYKEPEGITSVMKEFVLKDAGKDDRPAADLDMQWAEAVAEFGLLLRQSKMAPNADWGRMIERAEQSTVGNAYRLECVALMRKAAETHRNR